MSEFTVIDFCVSGSDDQDTMIFVFALEREGFSYTCRFDGYLYERGGRTDEGGELCLYDALSLRIYRRIYTQNQRNIAS